MVAAAFAALLGLLTLVGWVLDFDWLTRLAPGMTATNPMTALAFTLAALALALGPRRRPISARLLAGLVLGIGAAKLAALVTGLPFAVDRLMFAAQLGRTGDIEASLMPTASAFVLMLFGGALLLSGSRGRRAGQAAQILCGIVFAITLFVVVGYGLDAVALNGVIRIKMSFYSAVGFMALAAGTASIGFETGVARIMLDRGAAGSMARAALPFALLASMLVGTEDGSMVKVFTNLLVTLVLLAGCIVALLRTDRLRRRRESAMEQSDLLYRHAEQVGHIGHWLVEYHPARSPGRRNIIRFAAFPRTPSPISKPRSRSTIRTTPSRRARSPRRSRTAAAGRSGCASAGPAARCATSSRTAFASIPPMAT